MDWEKRWSFTIHWPSAEVSNHTSHHHLEKILRLSLTRKWRQFTVHGSLGRNESIKSLFHCCPLYFHWLVSSLTKLYRPCFKINPNWQWTLLYVLVVFSLTWPGPFTDVSTSQLSNYTLHRVTFSMLQLTSFLISKRMPFEYYEAKTSNSELFAHVELEV